MYIVSLRRIMSKKNANILLGRDFNCDRIDWENLSVAPGATKNHIQNQLVVIVKEHCRQRVNLPTRNDRTLDLLLTNIPGPVTRHRSLPPIGKAVHDIVFIEYDIKSKRFLQSRGKIYLYKRADMLSLKRYPGDFRDHVLSRSIVYSVEDYGSNVVQGFGCH